MKFMVRAIAVLQIYGGMWIAQHAVTSLFMSAVGAAGLLYLLFTCIAALSVVAGVLLLEGQDKGVRLSKWVQWVQVPIVYSPFVVWYMQIGASASGWIGNATGVNLTLSSDYALYLATGDGWSVGMNLLPVIALLVLRRV